MAKVSLIYKNIFMYRVIMNLLYLGKYRKRHEDIIALIHEEDHKILELCFGDIHIAEYCRDHGKEWTGIDINKSFTDFAVRNGHNAINNDILEMKEFPLNDLCIIAGSLYHFHDELEALLGKILDKTTRLIISEPIRNLSSGRGLIGRIARRSGNTEKGCEPFRFNETTLIERLEAMKRDLRFEYRIISRSRDIILELVHE